jgi:hypothetical protein
MSSGNLILSSDNYDSIAKNYDDFYEYNNTNRFYPKHFYLAGSFFNKSILSQRIEELEKFGHICTWNWTKVEQGERKPELMRIYSKNDIEGVKEAQVLIVVIDDKEYAYRGTFCEIGCALGLRKTIYIVCPEDDKYEEFSFNGCVFAWHPDIIRLKSWDELLKELNN